MSADRCRAVELPSGEVLRVRGQRPMSPADAVHLDAIVDAARRTLDAPEPRPCAPLLKWVGGKSHLLPEIMKRLPPLTGRYYEPFAGGAALFFHTGHAARYGAVLGDMNVDLMHAYREVARSPEPVIRRLRWMERQHARGRRLVVDAGRVGPSSFYKETRDKWNCASAIRSRFGDPWSDVQRAAAFLYLNRTCWNGVWRVNRRGDFNVPQGAYTSPTICDPARIRRASAALRQAALVTGPWQRTVAKAERGDVVYFDPPYVPSSPTASFTAYTRDGFGQFQQEELALGVRELVARGVFVLVSNSDTPLVRKLYKGLEVKRVKVPRAINCKATRRGAVNEVLIVGRP